jgi:methyl-accepting chemotaxis protein
MNDNQFGVLLEDMNSKMDGVVEAVGQVQDQVKTLPTMQSDIEEIKTDVKAIKAVVTDQDRRVTELENAR